MSDALGRATQPVGLDWARVSVRRARLGARAPRYLALGTLVVLALLGLRGLVAPTASAPARVVSGEVDRPAEDFALQFARAYLSYDSARPQAHQRSLAPFLPEGLDPDAGFSPGAESRQVLWAEVASDQPSMAGGRLITVAAQTTAQAQPVYLAATVTHRRDAGLALGGYPALVGAPSVDLHPVAVEREPVEDGAVAQVAKRVVRNYLGGEATNLAADLTPDAVVTLPTVRLAVQSVDQVLWADGPDSEAVLITVEASDPQGETHRLTYELGIRRRERPYVDFVEVIPTRG